MNEKNEKTVSVEERVSPMRVLNNETGFAYELDFNRESVKFAEIRGFEVDTVLKFPAIRIPELFYYAFRKNHKNMARSQTDALLDSLGGLTVPMIERLIQLYNQAALSHVINTEEVSEKNAKVTVEM